MKAGVLVLSDKGAAGLREDTSGPLLKNWLSEHGVETAKFDLIPDEFDIIKKTLAEWADSENIDIIISCGGTGVSPRDVAPEATRAVLDREIPGFGELMRMRSLQITPMAIISRAMAGIRRRSLILNLPGSPKAAIENLEAVWPAIPHAVAKIQGDSSDCADLHQADMQRQKEFHMPPIISFAGYSGSGKTTLITAVIEKLTGKGLRVGALKHEGHCFEIDKPGKDSWRMTQAGATATLISDKDKLALMRKNEGNPDCKDLIAAYFGDMDIVFVEGWKETAPARIEVYREQAGNPRLQTGKETSNLIAVATDVPLQTDLPQLDLNNVNEVCDFIIDFARLDKASGK